MGVHTVCRKIRETTCLVKNYGNYSHCCYKIEFIKPVLVKKCKKKLNEITYFAEETGELLTLVEI